MEDANRLLIQAVIMKNDGRTVLPLLRSIRWQVGDPLRDGALIPFFASTLRHARFTTDFGEVLSTDLLRRLRESSPVLESIYLNHVGPSLIQELLRFDRLSDISISRISRPGAFEAIVTKPNLAFLRVNDVGGTWVSPGPAVSVRDLRVLAVTGAVLSISSLFACARFYALEQASIHVTTLHQVYLRSADIMMLLGAFYASVSTSRVRTLNLSLLSMGQLPGDDFPALRDLLAAILPLSDLRSFTLAGLHDIMPVDDADIAALGGAWPKLEHLSIGTGTTKTSCMSLGALHHLAGACPNLRELSLPGLVYPAVGVYAIPTPQSMARAESEPTHPHPLRKLQVRARVVQKPYAVSISDETAEAVARYLLDLFPRLDGWEYKPAPEPPREPQPQPQPARPTGVRTVDLSKLVMWDDRWRKVTKRIYAICVACEPMAL